MCQEGIAYSIGIYRTHVPLYLRKLVEEGFVEERLAHIKGVKRRRKVYLLTEKGKEYVSKLTSTEGGVRFLLRGAVYSIPKSELRTFITERDTRRAVMVTNLPREILRDFWDFRGKIYRMNPVSKARFSAITDIVRKNSGTLVIVDMLDEMVEWWGVETFREELNRIIVEVIGTRTNVVFVSDEIAKLLNIPIVDVEGYHRERATNADFLGREEEIREIHHAIRNGRSVAVIGPPGIGKSRLVQEYLRRYGVFARWVPGNTDLSAPLLTQYITSGETVVVDDLSSERLRRFLAEVSSGNKIIVTSREDVDFCDKKIELGGLSVEDITRLMGVSRLRAEELYRKTGGNPFHLLLMRRSKKPERETCTAL
jgi:DNA-binding PadR family transcriptional regulator